MIREAQSVLVFLIGGALLRISLTDVYLRYVKEGLRPLLIAAGAALVLIALVTLVGEFIGDRRAAAAAGPGADAHDHHAHPGPKIAWLLLLPVMAIFLIAPPALGADAAGRSGTAVTAAPGGQPGGSSAEDEYDFEPLPKADPVRMPVLDYATRAVWDSKKTLVGRRVLLTGFLTPAGGSGAEAAGGRMYLTRMVLTCCAADARPIKVALSGQVPPDLTANTWVRVVGTYTPTSERDQVNREPIPGLVAQTTTRIPAPSAPYE